MQARKTHLEQMKGDQVASLMYSPKPLLKRNHMNAHLKYLKELGRKPVELKEKEHRNNYAHVKSRLDTWNTLEKRHEEKDYVEHNRRASTTSSRRSTPQDTPTPPKRHVQSPGQIPQYLIERKLEWAKKEQERIAVRPPPGMTLVPDEERLRALNALKTRFIAN
jgi:hypothetical protein